MIRCARSRYLCRRTDEVIRGMAQFIGYLHTLHITAVGKDIIEMGKPFQGTRHLGDVHPFLAPLVPICSPILAIGTASPCSICSKGILTDDPATGMAPKNKTITFCFCGMSHGL